MDKPAHSSDSSHDHGHSHSHGHSHGMEGGWAVWRKQTTLQVVLAGICGAALATFIGVIALWPDGSGKVAATEKAAEFSVVSEPVLMELTEVINGECSFSNPEEPEDRPQCITLTARTVDEYIPKAYRKDDVVNRNLIVEAGTLIGLNEVPVERYGNPELSVGDTVVFDYYESSNSYDYAGVERRGSLTLLIIIFVAVVIALSRVRGLTALLAMAVTVVILITFIAPSVLDGNNPILVSVVGASMIAFLSLYLTHGFTPGTTVALAGTLSALALTLGLSWFFFEIGNFTGLASEEGATLTILAAGIDMRALLLGGAIIGALGALDDVTVTQVATVSELRLRNPELTVADLVTSGIRVGREHIASTVNTLLLAYAGVSMPLLLLFAISNQSLDMVANTEIVAVEIVRTLCGSIGLVAAVPITTFLAALVHARIDPAELLPASESAE